MDKVHYFNTIGHYTILIITIYQLKTFYIWLTKKSKKVRHTITKAPLDEKTARDIFIDKLRANDD